MSIVAAPLVLMALIAVVGNVLYSVRPGRHVFAKYPIGVRFGLGKWQAKVDEGDVAALRRYIRVLHIYCLILLVFILTSIVALSSLHVDRQLPP